MGLGLPDCVGEVDDGQGDTVKAILTFFMSLLHLAFSMASVACGSASFVAHAV